MSTNILYLLSFVTLFLKITNKLRVSYTSDICTVSFVCFSLIFMRARRQNVESLDKLKSNMYYSYHRSHIVTKLTTCFAEGTQSSPAETSDSIGNFTSRERASASARRSSITQRAPVSLGLSGHRQRAARCARYAKSALSRPSCSARGPRSDDWDCSARLAECTVSRRLSSPPINHAQIM